MIKLLFRLKSQLKYSHFNHHFNNDLMQIKKESHFCNSLVFCVGVAGFEPATPCSQSRCASRTALCPDQLGGEGGIRTPGSLWSYDSLANCWFQPLTHLSVFRGFASAKVHIFFKRTTFFCKKIILFFIGNIKY